MSWRKASTVEWAGVVSILAGYGLLFGFALLFLDNEVSHDLVIQTIMPSSAAVFGAVTAYIKSNLFEKDDIEERRFSRAGAIVVVGMPMIYAFASLIVMQAIDTSSNPAHTGRLMQVFSGLTAVFSAVYVFIAVQVYNPHAQPANEAME